MQDRKRHDGQDRFSEITKAILGCCFDVINTLGCAADQLFGSDEFVGWPIGKFWEKKVGIQKSTSSLPIMAACDLCKSLFLFED